MSRVGSVRPKEFIRKLRRFGFVVDHQTGSHVILLHPNGTRLTVPYLAREMKRGLLMALSSKPDCPSRHSSGSDRYRSDPGPPSGLTVLDPAMTPRATPTAGIPPA